MPINQNEPNEELRTVSATLYDTGSVLLPAGTTWLAGMTKISKAGGAFENTDNLPVAVSGGGDGAFDLVLTIPEVDTVGTVRVRFYDAVGGNLIAEYSDIVEDVPVPVSTSPWGAAASASSRPLIKADILAIAPQLSTLADAAWVMILAFINDMDLRLEPNLRKLALAFLGAHMGTMTSTSGASGATGAVISESAGGLKRTYANPTASASIADLSRTNYGQQYLAIMKFSWSTRGPILV